MLQYKCYLILSCNENFVNLSKAVVEFCVKRGEESVQQLQKMRRKSMSAVFLIPQSDHVCVVDERVCLLCLASKNEIDTTVCTCVR